MNTNGNIYTVVYTTIVVVIVAALLSFVAMKLKPIQLDNEKAETISQIMTAAQIGSKAEISALSNEAILAKYSEVIDEAYIIDTEGNVLDNLKTSKESIELIDNFKPQDKAIKDKGEAKLPVYKFKSGVCVIPVYGAGLWGPIWGYIALDKDLCTIVGAYFDHAGETPGLGAKIKDDPDFQERFKGKVFDLDNAGNVFSIVKVGASNSDSSLDGITGATMTCKGLNAGINTWVKAYSKYLLKASKENMEENCNE